MGNRLYKFRPVGVREQLAYMKLLHPMFTCCVRQGRLVCRGIVQPTPLHEKHQVRISYRVGKVPSV